jgi:hypothetical protein
VDISLTAFPDVLDRLQGRFDEVAADPAMLAELEVQPEGD